jgi:prepilin-type N-terminal cleavage/methylation domain-containing protein
METSFSPSAPSSNSRPTEKESLPHHLRLKTHTLSGFSLVELIIVLFVIGILSSLIIPEVLSVRTTSLAALCGTNLKAIETAKNNWRRDFPDSRNPTKQELSRYFPGGVFPTDPWGIGFNAGIGGAIVSADSDLIDLSIQASHRYNNDPSHEPKNNCSPNNGYNDLAPLSP